MSAGETTNSSSSYERAHFRLRYPEQECPVLRIGEHRFPVSELSEGGLRLLYSGPEPEWEPGDPIGGCLVVATGEYPVHGEFLRWDESEAVFKISQGIDLQGMMREQKYLLKKYPARFGKDGSD